jgi:tetratricopeptide (TPR) repeat protein
MALGALVYPLVYLLGKRTFDSRTGLIAWGLALGYGPLLLAPQEIAGTWIEALFAVLIPLVLSSPLSSRRLAVAGLLGGAAVLSRPNLLPYLFLAPVVVWAGSASTPERPAAIARRSAVFLLAAAVAILPVTVRNLVAGNDLVLVTSHGGINFFIGNSPGARGTFYAPPGFHEDPISINSRDAQAIASAEEGRTLSPSQASRHWFGRGLGWIAGNPADAAKLYFNKLLLLAHAYEVPLNSTYSLFREHARLLALLAVPFPLLLLAGAPALLAPAQWRRLLPISLLLLVQAAGVLGFFVSSRYRLPMAPLLAVPAAATPVALAALFRRNRFAGIAGASSLALAVALLCIPTALTSDIDLDSRASSFESLGIHLYDAGRHGEAEAELRRAIALRPAIRAPHWYLARILEKRGDFAGAAGFWRRAAELYGPDTTWGAEAARKAGR